jgi:hypothetical protein
MHDHELNGLRRELAGMVRGPGRGYPDELKARMLAWARRRVAEGDSVNASASALELHPRTLGAWLGSRRGRTAPVRSRPDPVARTSVSLVPVEVVATSTSVEPSIALVSPSGYRLEGLTVDDAVRALARLG